MPSSPPRAESPLYWWSVAAGIVLIGGALVASHLAAQGTVQDDMIQHVVWFRHWLPGTELPLGPIADFFMAMNTPAYRLFYRSLASAGIDPVAAAWAVALIGSLLTMAGMSALLRAVGMSRGDAALGAAVMAIVILFRDDMATGSARALGWPVLLWALWAAAARRPLAYAFLTTLGAALYPPVAAFILTVGGLMCLDDLRRDRRIGALVPWALAVIAPVALILADQMTPSAWGAMMSGREAALLPDFGPNGRTPIFGGNAVSFYLFDGSRTGLFSGKMIDAWPVMIAGIAGLFCLRRASMAEKRMLAVLAGAGVLLWAAAHATLFLLYLPARFSVFGLGIAMAMLATRALATMARRSVAARRAVAAGLLAVPLVFPFLQTFPVFSIERAKAPGLMAQIRDDGVRGMVAGTADDLSYVPVLTNRSIWWSRETQFPYVDRFRRFMNGRLQETVAVLTVPRPEPALQWARARGIRYLLVDGAMFDPKAAPRWWMPLIDRAGKPLVGPRAGWTSAWPVRPNSCRTVENGVWLFDLACMDRDGGEPAS